MLTSAQREQIVAILDAGADLTIATVRADGYPQATTVSYASEGLNIYFGTWTKSQKALNLAKCDKVSATIDLPYQDWSQIRGLSLGGRARRVADPAEMAKVGALMFKKFPQLGAFVQADNAEMALFRIDAEVFSILDYSKGFGHTELAQV
ncbi:MAG: pyridoxamine 5'-phosphate oxidase family protein [Hyphomonadaceae bacterium]|nr:pyridoxamine 5'-phosphate oxidase family protein [Hyphomonadaceae bacterium]